MERIPFSLETPAGIALAGDVAGEGPTMILVHGLGFHRKRWQAQVEALVGAGLRVVTYDLRGFGDSPAPKQGYVVADLVEDLEAVRAHLGLDRFHLLGHSLGGMVALAYAMDHTARLNSLVLASTTSHNGKRAGRMSRIMARLSHEGSGAALADAAFADEVNSLVRDVSGYVNADAFVGMLAAFTERPHPARAMAWAALEGFSVRARLGELDLPTLVIHGDADHLMPMETGILIHAGIPHSKWAAMEGGHNLPRESRVAFNTAVLDFLDEEIRA